MYKDLTKGCSLKFVFNKKTIKIEKKSKGQHKGIEQINCLRIIKKCVPPNMLV